MGFSDKLLERLGFKYEATQVIACSDEYAGRLIPEDVDSQKRRNADAGERFSKRPTTSVEHASYLYADTETPA